MIIFSPVEMVGVLESYVSQRYRGQMYYCRASVHIRGPLRRKAERLEKWIYEKTGRISHRKRRQLFSFLSRVLCLAMELRIQPLEDQVVLYCRLNTGDFRHKLSVNSSDVAKRNMWLFARHGRRNS